MQRTRIREIFSSQAGQQHTVKGWVRSKRGNKNVVFLAINDGSCVASLQVVVDPSKCADELLRDITTGASVSVDGLLVASPGGQQGVELQAENLSLLGTADPQTYPLQKKGHSLEFLREIAHLRPRTNTFGAILRLRHEMAYAIHDFFHKRGFVYLHTPLITSSDAEGAGAMFRVTTLPVGTPPLTKDGNVDWSADFFGTSTNLTVSGQLEGELGATALGEVYTFGPTFRAENSNTPRHLAEFWMIEPEMAFYEIEDNMDLAEEMLKSLISHALTHCADDLKFLNDMWDKGLIERLQSILKQKFVRLTYTEAINILLKADVKWEYPISAWGADLQSEHERYLVEKHFHAPVILTDYPAEIKAFYMKMNDDGKTVRAMDVLFPMIGEIIGGSQREEDYNKLQTRMEAMGVPVESMSWYLDTRRFGSVPHSGFGLGFERLMLFVTGMTNIRDVIPFPRTPKHCDF